MLENADTEKMKSTSLDGYRLFSTEVEYGGVKQRWVVVFSKKAFMREPKTLEKKIKKEEGERTGGESGMASLQSGVLQRGRRTEGCTGEGKAVEVSHDKRNCDGDKEEESETIPDQKGKPTQK